MTNKSISENWSCKGVVKWIEWSSSCKLTFEIAADLLIPILIMSCQEKQTWRPLLAPVSSIYLVMVRSTVAKHVVFTIILTYPLDQSDLPWQSQTEYHFLSKGIPTFYIGIGVNPPQVYRQVLSGWAIF